MVKFDRDIPIPPSGRGDKTKTAHRKIIEAMAVGDSYAWPLEVAAIIRTTASIVGRTLGRTYVTRQLVENEKHVVRVWRLPD